MNTTASTLATLLVALALAACASEPRPTQQRGWIGGRFTAVSRTYESSILSSHHGDVVGMPESAPGDHAELVTEAYAATPLAHAGLAPGDLVLSVDGVAADDALALREHVESLTPGARVPVSFWRGGETRTTDVVVGRETYRSAGTVTVRLGISSALDLWPFDDGIDIFGLLQWRWDHDRNDVTGVVPDYRREVRPGDPVEGPLQEKTEGFLLLVGAAKGKVVVSQETLP